MNSSVPWRQLETEIISILMAQHEHLIDDGGEIILSGGIEGDYELNITAFAKALAERLEGRGKC